MTKSNSLPGKSPRFGGSPTAAYYGLLLVLLIAGLFPQLRLWGLNWWGYFPLWAGVPVLVLLAVLPVIPGVTERRSTSAEEGKGATGGKGGFFSAWTILAGVALVALFIVLRSRTHFLGDGYEILAALSHDQLVVKPTGYGGAFLHRWLYRLLGANGEVNALLSYRIVSITAGTLFITVVGYAAYRLFSKVWQRVLFFIGTATGGYVLLFFGYVEHYAFFILAVTAYALIGLLTVKRRAVRWAILPALAAALFFHAFGVALIPSAVYVIVSGKRIPERVSFAAISAILSVVAIGTVLMAAYLGNANLTLRLSILPLLADQFTVDGYTIISGRHLLDLVNLLVLLLPGLPVLVAAMVTKGARTGCWREPETVFLSLLTLSAVGLAALVDPKLGMPRDWDLLSFCGVPLAVLGYYSLLAWSSQERIARRVGILAIALGVSILAPRVLSQADPSVSEKVIESYIDLDQGRSRTAKYVLTDYYEKADRTEELERLGRKWADELQDNVLLANANSLLAGGNPQSALVELHRLVKVNPGIPAAWEKIGQAYYMLGQYDSCMASMNIAVSLNAYSTSRVFNLGLVSLQLKAYGQAELAFQRAFRLDSTNTQALVGLAEVYGSTDQSNEYRENLLRLGERPDAPLHYVRELADHYLAARNFAQASRLLRMGLDRGLDSAYYRQVAARHPELGL